MATALSRGRVAWAAATLPLPGESVCGDTYVVEAFGHGALIALIDALGHGREAERAARVAAQVLSQHCREDPVALIQRCHDSLRGLRGAAVSIASIDAARHTLSWVGIGNVAGRLVGMDSSARVRVRELVGYGGVVGDRLPEFSASVAALTPSDVLILTTDGIAPHAPEAVPATDDLQHLADRILVRFAKRTDDAAVLVARLNGA